MMMHEATGGFPMDIHQIIESVKQMSAGEKATIAHSLIASLETRQDQGVDQAWAGLAREI